MIIRYSWCLCLYDAYYDVSITPNKGKKSIANLLIRNRIGCDQSGLNLLHERADSNRSKWLFSFLMYLVIKRCVTRARMWSKWVTPIIQSAHWSPVSDLTSSLSECMIHRGLIVISPSRDRWNIIRGKNATGKGYGKAVLTLWDTLKNAVFLFDDYLPIFYYSIFARFVIAIAIDQLYFTHIRK